MRGANGFLKERWRPCRWSQKTQEENFRELAEAAEGEVAEGEAAEGDAAEG